MTQPQRPANKKKRKKRLRKIRLTEILSSPLLLFSFIPRAAATRESRWNAVLQRRAYSTKGWVRVIDVRQGIIARVENVCSTRFSWNPSDCQVNQRFKFLCKNKNKKKEEAKEAATQCIGGRHNPIRTNKASPRTLLLRRRCAAQCL